MLEIGFPGKCISAGPIISTSFAICIALFKTVFSRSLIHVDSKIHISFVTLLKWSLNPKCWQHHSAGHQNFNLGKLKKKFLWKELLKWIIIYLKTMLWKLLVLNIWPLKEWTWHWPVIYWSALKIKKNTNKTS